MLGIDTFTWTKIFWLMDEGWRDAFEELLAQMPFFITEDMIRELKHFHPTSEKKWSNGNILKRRNITFSDYIRMGFDEADASLLEYSELPEYTIITEDRPMLAQNVYKQNNIIQLVDLIKIYYDQGYFTKKEYRFIITWLRKKRNIGKKKEKQLLKNN